MPQTGTEVIYRTTGDCSIELGSPKEGRVKLFFEPEEVADTTKAQLKIDHMGDIMDYARRRFSSPAKSTNKKV